MSRILVASEARWYEEQNVIASYYEAEFERKIRQQVGAVFPDYYTSSFKIEIQTDQKEPRKPDLAMVHKDFKDWWIVEVELIGHPLPHVIDQVSVFTQGNYNSIRIADYLKQKNVEENSVELDYNKLREMIFYQQPKVLVIVDEQQSDWESELSKHGASVCLFQVYRNTSGSESFRLNGEYPECYYGESHCRYHRTIPNLLEVLSPSLLEEEGEEILLFYNDRSTSWKRIDEGESVFLKLIGSVNPLPANTSYVLRKDTHGRLIIRIN